MKINIALLVLFYLYSPINGFTCQQNTVNRGYFAIPGAILSPPLIIDKILWFLINTIYGIAHLCSRVVVVWLPQVKVSNQLQESYSGN